jgi:GNAT superfamily N-acetyltransferase
VSVTVRGLDPDDWRLLREMRLAALADSPQAFLMTVEEATRWSEDTWRTTAPRRAVAFVDEVPVGMVGWHEAEAHTELVGLWVHPAHRGGLVAPALVDHVVAVARAPIELEVILSNRMAAAFYAKVGFARSPVPPTRHDHDRLRLVPPIP